MIERSYVVVDHLRNDRRLAEWTERTRFTSSSLSAMTEEHLLEWYVQSQTFHELSRAEQAMSHKAIRTCMSPGAHWGMEYHIANDGLFDGTVIDGTVPADVTDAYVLSGALGWFISGEGEDRGDFLGEGFDASLVELKLLGALSLQAMWPIGAGSTMSISNDPTRHDGLAIGADFHGDFGMWEVTGPNAPVISPMGTVEMFAPAEINGVAGYHSIEPDIVAAVIRHLAHDKSRIERKALYHYITGLRKERIVDGSQAFGDYGASDRHLEDLSYDTWGDWYEGNVLDELRVKPGRDDVLRISSLEDAVQFENIAFQEGEEDAGKPIVIQNDSLPEFIATLAHSDQGRTAPEDIGALLRMLLMKD